MLCVSATAALDTVSVSVAVWLRHTCAWFIRQAANPVHEEQGDPQSIGLEVICCCLVSEREERLKTGVESLERQEQEREGKGNRVTCSKTDYRCSRKIDFTLQVHFFSLRKHLLTAGTAGTWGVVVLLSSLLSVNTRTGYGNVAVLGLGIFRGTVKGAQVI